jgi:diguanylate cyclase (GGDEF)-like protein
VNIFDQLPNNAGAAASSPLRFVLTLLICIFGTEAVIMAALPLLLPMGTSGALGALLDSSCLTLILSPIVWRVVIRPLRTQAHQLGQLNHRLSQEIVERQVLEEKLSHQAQHDGLTGLPNRAFFMKQLERLVRRGKDPGGPRFAVLFIDLDRFKSLNDTLGHGAGDLLLMQVADRFCSVVRLGDTVARLGGDEFTILLANLPADEDVARIAQRILDEAARPFLLHLRQADDVRVHEVHVTASIGVVIAGGDQSQQAEDILRDADIAMYRAKATGRACFQIFDAHMHARVAERFHYEESLRCALDSLASAKPQFFLVYQPIVRLGSGRIRAFEALLRWNHPQRGPVPPHDFIPIAEETGMIIRLGAWFLHQACRQARAWHNQPGENLPGGDGDITVSVNLSAQQLVHPGLADEVEHALLASGLPARCLNLEITETVAMRNLPQVSSLLARFREMGVGLSLDDFGTGYSPLSCLHQLPFTALKIDRSFIHRISSSSPEGTQIVRAIMGLAHSFGLSVVAEGVETEEQRAILQNLGCDLCQGYLIARPLTAEEAHYALELGRERSTASGR